MGGGGGGERNKRGEDRDLEKRMGRGGKEKENEGGKRGRRHTGTEVGLEITYW